MNTREAAKILGSIKTIKKARSSVENGKLGGASKHKKNIKKTKKEN